MDTLDKLKILADAAKYDVSCSSSGSARKPLEKGLGNTALPGICHSFSDDGRCISLFKILMTNHCMYDCAYCQNRSSNGEIKRATFTVQEIVDLTIQFYRRNYIEGLFLSSGIIKSPSYTMSLLLEVVKRLREVERFNGYIHLKGIPGAEDYLIESVGRYVDRLSVNIELPTTKGLRLLAPEKDRKAMIQPMQLIKEKHSQYIKERSKYRKSIEFAPAGQTTQVILGATQEADYSVLKISEALYDRMDLKRVYYSAYTPVGNLPAVVPELSISLRREHRMYQADWLLRFYGFKADEILSKSDPFLDMDVDPKCQWALRNMHYFPVEINKAPFAMLLRIPGVGNISARRIVEARKFGRLNFDDLKKLGVVVKRAKYFITCAGKTIDVIDLNPMRLKTLMVDGPKPQLSFYELYPQIFGG